MAGKNIKCLLFILFSSSALTFGQTIQSLERRLLYLEQSLDSLKTQVEFHEQLYYHPYLELNKIRSELALGINRNFIYFATFYETESDTKNSTGYQRVFVFYGYNSESYQNQSLYNDQAGYIKTVRQNLNGIKKIIIGKQTTKVELSENYIIYPNRVIINIFDNSTGSEPTIVADTDPSSLKIRINGILQEVGWE